ncbi:MAG: polysaccharide deacetylase, partial [Acidobacteriales bacterium]|nr:polysaccharide deacetylase [Terriglobales bacterium]
MAAYDENGYDSLMAQPVFYDPRQARWKRLRRLFDVLGVISMALVVFFVYSVAHGESLPTLLFIDLKKPYHALKENEKEKAKEKRRLAVKRSHRKSASPPSQVPLNAEEGIRAAFYTPWDAASFSSLREYARQIDLLFPDWLHVLTPDGHLQGVDNDTNKYFDLGQGNAHSVDDKVMAFLKAEDTGMEVFPMVNNTDGVDWVDISSFLSDGAARNRFRQQIVTFLASDKYRGLMVDFESFPKRGQPGYLILLTGLSSDLHSRGMKLYVSLPARNSDFNYGAISAVVDGIVLMNYDEHYPGGTPGPVASQDWFTANLTWATKAIPANKLICAIGNYGYDWVRKPKQGKLPSDVKDTNVSVQAAWLAARDSEEEVDFDGDSSNPHIAYLDEKNLQHDIWFLDAVTALN